MAQAKKPKPRPVHHIWPGSRKTAVFPGGSYRIAWDDNQQAWAVQFPKIVYLLYTEDKKNLCVKGTGKDDKDVDIYHEDDSLFEYDHVSLPLSE